MSNISNPGLNILRFKAITMLEAGFTQKKVARQLGKTLKTVNNWWRRSKRGKSLDDKPRSGRPSSITSGKNCHFQICWEKTPVHQKIG